MSLVDPVNQKDANPSQTQSQQDPAPVVPEKLKGKTTDEVYEMYLNAEKDRSRMANELGDVRSMADRLLKIEESRAAGAADVVEEEVTIDPTELLADPTATISKYFETREQQLTKRYDEKISALESQVAGTTVSVQHADAQQVLNSAEFIEYCKEDPFRLRAAQMGAAGDQQALVELLNSYKAKTASTETTTETPASGNAPTFEGSATGDAPASTGQIIKRADIIRKKLEDPEGYLDPAYQAEITKAYQEGRVK